MADMAVIPRSQLSEGKEPGLQAHEAVSSWTSYFPLLVLSFLIFKQRWWSLLPRGGSKEIDL